jgi:hypothetical protein
MSEQDKNEMQSAEIETLRVDLPSVQSLFLQLWPVTGPATSAAVGPKPDQSNGFGERGHQDIYCDPRLNPEAARPWPPVNARGDRQRIHAQTAQVPAEMIVGHRDVAVEGDA